MQLFANNARALLTAGISALDTALSVEAGKADLFPVGTTADWITPANWFKVTIEDELGNNEVVKVGTRVAASGNMTILLRGQDGTVARAFAAGCVVELRLTAQDLQGSIDLASTATAFGKSILVAVDAAVAMTALGFSAFFKTLVTAVDAAAMRTLLFCAKYGLVDRTALAAGTVDAITLAFSPTMTALDNGPVWWRATGTNTLTAPTEKRDGLALKTIVKGVNQALSPGDIPGAGAWMCTVYDTTLDKVVLLNPATGIPQPNYKSGKRQTVSSCAIAGDSSTVTITNATPAVITYAAHGKEANSPLVLTNVGGALPTGLTAGTTVFVSATGLTANTFQVSATAGGASIATSSAGSGTHTATFGASNAPPDAPLLGGALGGTSVTTSNISAANPLIATVASGFDANGPVDLVGRAVANLTWTTWSTNGTWGIFVDIAGGVITPVNGCLPLPTYQRAGNFSIAAGQLVFNYSLMIGKVGNGATAAQSARLCVGEFTVAGGVVTSITWYQRNREYESEWTNTLVSGVLVSKNSNLGVPDQTAWMVAEAIGGNGGFAIGDRFTVFTDNPGSSGNFNQLPIVHTRNTVQFFKGLSSYYSGQKNANTAFVLDNPSYKWKLVSMGVW
ncbi:MAG: hypothetical protein V4614_14870 [Pseudomonadota bacterium]